MTIKRYIWSLKDDDETAALFKPIKKTKVDIGRSINKQNNQRIYPRMELALHVSD